MGYRGRRGHVAQPGRRASTLVQVMAHPNVSDRVDVRAACRGAGGAAPGGDAGCTGRLRRPRCSRRWLPRWRRLLEADFSLARPLRGRCDADPRRARIPSSCCLNSARRRSSTARTLASVVQRTRPTEPASTTTALRVQSRRSPASSGVRSRRRSADPRRRPGLGRDGRRLGAAREGLASRQRSACRGVHRARRHRDRQRREHARR